MALVRRTLKTNEMHEETKQILQTIGGARRNFAPSNLRVDQLRLATLSYSLVGEDLSLRQVFKRRIAAKQSGTYVDIGCAAPVSISNTYLFYCLGWRGLCVDANSGVASDWANIRQGDAFVNAAVGETGGEVLLFRHKKDPGMNRIASDAQSLGADFDSTGTPVPMRRLDDLFAAHIGDAKIQFMTIDVEGGELGALRSNDWKRWRPEAILMECNDFNFMAPTAAPSVSYLLERDYALYQKIGANVLLLDRQIHAD